MHKGLILPALAVCFCLSPGIRAAGIIFVTEPRDANADGIQDDLGFEDFLIGLGHEVDVRRGHWTRLDAAGIAELNAADLIVVSRSVSSSNYDDDAVEIANWNGLTTPILLLHASLARGTDSNFRWHWVNSAAIDDLPAPRMQVVELYHPIFKGIPLDPGNLVDASDGTVGTGRTSFVGTIDVGNGKLLAQAATGGNAWIVEWQPGIPYYPGSPATPGDKRLLFCAGTQRSDDAIQGAFNLTDDGRQILANAVNYLLGMAGQMTATSPLPAEGATDVRPDAMLAWTPGESAATHDVYFGTDRDAVAAANRTVPLGALVSRGQDANTYDPAGVLELGRTYYWRIDEVNSAPDFKIFRGRIWSLTVEPVLYPIRNITVTASSSDSEDLGPGRTIDGSGLNADDQHSIDIKDMWLSGRDALQPTWIQYEFDRTYKLDRLLVWNSNQFIESIVGFGARNVIVACSTDGELWTRLGDFEFAQAPGEATYTPDTAVDFGGAPARYVKLTITSNWGGLVTQYSLSEVRFLHIPVLPREPAPASGAADVEFDTSLTWRAGREAVLHKVYFATDRQAVIDGTALVGTVSDSHFDPGPLRFGATCYWKVVEVNEAAVPEAWEGDLWSFSTKEYFLVDGFEDYTDDEGSRIYQTWIDGYTDNANGSIVGYLNAPFAEQTIVYAGRQSMPFEYNNVSPPFYSEAERTWSTPQDWTVNNSDTLFVHVRGNPPGLVEADSGIRLSAAGADIGGAADEFTFACKPLSGNGAIAIRVDSIENTSAWAKAGVMIRDGLGADARNAMVYVTPDGRIGRQFREVPGGPSDGAYSDPGAVAPPHWVRLTRAGNTLTPEHSRDGIIWEPIAEAANSADSTLQDIPMGSAVYAGLALTGHSPDNTCTASFSGASVTGASGPWQFVEVGIDHPLNDPAVLYVGVKDAAGRMGVVSHPDAVLQKNWQSWRIPQADFRNAGVNLRAVKTMYIGVGNPDDPLPGGAGRIYIDDIGIGRPAP